MSNLQIKESLDKTQKALIAFKLMLDKPMDVDKGYRDASIQRFEFTIELTWKLLKQVLNQKGVDVTYPKDVLKAAYQGQMINDEVLWLNVLKDRNLTSHTYNEELADEIYKRLKTYCPVIEKLIMDIANSF